MKQKTPKNSKISRLIVVALAIVAGGSFIITPIVQADQFDQKIQALEVKNSEKQARQSELGAVADSLSSTIDKLQAQINTLQAQIDKYTTKINDLKQEIAAQEAELQRQRGILGEDIRAMYLEGDISTIEMLASSENLSDFLDKQQYRATVQNKIQDTLDSIRTLQAKLNDQKQEAQAILDDKTQAQQDLDQQRSQQAHLLSLNKSQQDALNSQIQTNFKKIADLRAQQAAINAAHFSGYTIVAGHNGSDTYPDVWRNASQDSMIDSWGMYNRECVSYTAWKVASTGHHMPYWGGRGNANEWPGDARGAGIPVDGNPRSGDIAIAYWGAFGHAMFVDSVNSDGTINISQYNWDFHGHYSQIYHFSASGLAFIHFR